MAKKLKPVHPGEILREEFLTPLGLSMNKMAMALRVPATRIAHIVNDAAPKVVVSDVEGLTAAPGIACSRTE